MTFPSSPQRFDGPSFTFHPANSCADSAVILQQVEHLAWMGAAIVAGTMLVLWIIHLLIRNAAIVDVGWAAGLSVLAFFYAIAAPGYAARRWATASMVGFWGLRLAAYLLFARVIGKSE